MANRAVIATAVAGIILATFYIVVALRSTWARVGVNGPSFFPILVGGLFLLGAVGTILEEMFKRSQPAEVVEWPRGSALHRMVAVAAAALGYAMLLGYLGHVLVASLVAFVVLHMMGMRSWLIKVTVSAAIGFGSLYLFRGCWAFRCRQVFGLVNDGLLRLVSEIVFGKDCVQSIRSADVD